MINSAALRAMINLNQPAVNTLVAEPVWKVRRDREREGGRG